jgi:arylsulfatase A-like enzyme
MNLLLIVIDSLRSDRLSCLGHARPTSPTLDRLAESGCLFLSFFTPTTPTHPAITTLFTGQHPLTHGIVARSDRLVLAADAPWFAETLADAGYATAAIDNIMSKGRWTWFGRGFESYINLRRRDEYIDCFAMNQAAIEWLSRRDRRPFFLYMRYGDTHTPYVPPVKYRGLFYAGDPTTTNRGSLDGFYRSPLKPVVVSGLGTLAAEWPGARGRRIEDIEFVRSQYDAEIRVADDGVAEILGELERLRCADDTLVAILGDHGEALGEHGIYFEHHGLYDNVLRPPLILCGPGVPRGRRVDTLAQLMDVAPTVLELLGCAAAPGMEGRSLVPFFEPGRERRADSQVLAAECTWMAKWALRKEGFKVIVSREPDFYGNPPVELYDLRSDPAETRNLAEEQCDVRDAWVEDLELQIATRLAELGRSVDPVREHGSLRDKIFRKPSFQRRMKRLVRSLLTPPAIRE